MNLFGILIAIYLSGCYGSYSDTLTAITNMLYPHYLWSNSESTQTIIVSAQGAYTVTVSDTLGCSTTANHIVDSIPAYRCCFTHPLDSIIPIYTNDSSSNITIPPDSQVYIAPGVVFRINTPNFSLQNNEIVMGANSEIIVDADDTFYILGSTLHGCDTMWKGIVVNSVGAIIVDSLNGSNSTIEDAIYGIVAYGVSGQPLKMLVRNTNFYKNQYGIVFYNYIPLSDSAYDVSNCYFGMGNYTNMLPAPAGIVNYNRPVAGIVDEWNGISPSSFITVSIPNPSLNGQPNAFQYMNTGIYAINSVLNIYDNTFDSIRNYEAVNTYNFYGTAIVGSPNFFSIGNSNYLNVRTSDTIPDSLSTARFTNCDYGIKALNYALNASNNRMENVVNGIYTQNCNSNIEIYNNYIHNASYGISLINNSSAAQVVDTNIIFIAPSVPEPTITPFGYYVSGHFIPIDTIYGATSLQTYGIEETEVTSSNTIIKHNVIYQGINDIILNNAANTIVSGNTMHLACPNAVYGGQSGLYASNCKNLLVTFNTCDADSDYYDSLPPWIPIFPQAASRFHKTGLSFYNTPTANICSNTLGGTNSNKGIGYGMLYSGNCNDVNLYSNNMNKSWYGLTLLSSGVGPVIGSQGNSTTYNNNDFVGSFSGSDATYSYLSNPIHTYFYYSTTHTPASTYHPSNNGCTIANFEIQFPSIAGGSSETCQLILTGPPHFQRSTFDSIVAEDSVVYYLQPGLDTSTAKWLVDKMLYESLLGDTATLNNDSLFNAFYVEKNATDIGAILLSELENRLLTDSVTLTGHGAAGSLYSYTFSTAEALNNIIPDSNIQAANYKIMSGIYLRTLGSGVDTFTSGQLDTIKNLAIKCPYVDGDAVYMARALFTQVDNSIFFNDLIICQPAYVDSGRMMRVSLPFADTTNTFVPQKEFVNIYPNPASTLLNLRFYAQTSGIVEFDLTDQLGQSVIKQLLGNTQTFTQFAIGNLSSGIYYWKLKDSLRTIKANKVAIIK